MSMFGFLNVNKPLGITSHDCVAKVRQLLKIKRVGHGGTLDPLAQGVLPIAVGKTTRLLAFLPDQKGYRAKIRFGIQTTTDDLEGEPLKSQACPHLQLTDVKPHLNQFIGTIQQIPPAYSAIQQDGKRLYELARKGELINIPARTVDVRQIEIVSWNAGDFPELEVMIFCRAGTYIRSIARDLGQSLNVGGTLAFLERTESGGMNLSNSLSLVDIEEQIRNQTFIFLPPEIILAQIETITVGKNTGKRWANGQQIPLELLEYDISNKTLPFTVKVLYQSDFLGIGQIIDKNNQILLIPKVVI